VDAVNIDSIDVPGHRSLVWFDEGEDDLDKALQACWACIRLGDSSNISDASLSTEMMKEAVGIGERYFDHRDRQKAIDDSLERLTSIIAEVRKNRSLWTFWFPITRLVLPKGEPSITIGPVEIQGDDLGSFVLHGEEGRSLGEYGAWAVESHQLREEENLKFWTGHFGEVFSVAKVKGIAGDEAYAYRGAREEIAKAFAILRVVHRRYGSWSGQNDFVVPGEPLFVPISFELKGSGRGSVTSVLAHDTRAQSDESDSDENPSLPTKSYTLRTDLFSNVSLDNYIWVERKELVRKMADLVWPGNKWPEIVAAIRVFDESTRIGFAGAAFLGLMNSIEILIGGDQRDWADTVTTRIAERVGYLLGNEDPDFRMRLAKSFRKLYGKRSAITHKGGSVDLLDMGRMESIARILILRMVWEVNYRGINDFESFKEWIHGLKFGEEYEVIEVPKWLQLSESWLD
jgi:hypothetical protein